MFQDVKLLLIVQVRAMKYILFGAHSELRNKKRKMDKDV